MLQNILCHFILGLAAMVPGAVTSTAMEKSDITLHTDNGYILAEYQILPHSANEIKFVPALTQNTSYEIQFHAVSANVTLSLQEGLARYSDEGSDLGVVFSPSVSSRMYISNTHGSPVTVRANARLLGHSVPLPGGCNEEFNLPEDPRILLEITGYTYRLTFQYSSVAAWDTCEKKSLWDRLVYKLHGQMQHNKKQTGDDVTLYAAMSQLLDPDTIHSHSSYSVELGTRSDIGRPSFEVSRFRSADAMFTVTVTDKLNGAVSAYVPVLVRHGPMDIPWYWYFLATLLALVSLPILYCSHSWFSLAQFYAGSVALALLAVMSLGALDIAPVGVAFGSLAFSILGGALWLLVWKLLGKPTISIILISMVGGYLFTSICFFSPLVSMKVFIDYPWEIWMITAIVILLALAASVIFRKKLHILSSVFVSSYLITLALSLYCESIFHFIVVERFRRATVSDYSKVIFATDFQPKDGGVLAVWVFLLVSGAIVQFYRTRNDPDLPPAPDRRCSQRPRTSGRSTSQGGSRDEIQNLINQGQETENLSQHIPHYGAVDS